MTTSLNTLRAQAPNAKIFITVPYGLQYAGRFAQSYFTALMNGVAASNANATVINCGVGLANQLESSGTTYLNSASGPTSDVHPNTAGQALVAACPVQPITSVLAGSGAVTCSGSRACAISTGATISP